jgi:hypothetical protein
MGNGPRTKGDWRNSSSNLHATLAIDDQPMMAGESTKPERLLIMAVRLPPHYENPKDVNTSAGSLLERRSVMFGPRRVL